MNVNFSNKLLNCYTIYLLYYDDMIRYDNTINYKALNNIAANECVFTCYEILWYITKTIVLNIYCKGSVVKHD